MTIEHADVAEDAEVTLILPMGSGLTVSTGIRLYPNSTLTIWGSEADYHNDGELNVLGADYRCAGIGRGWNDRSYWMTLVVNGGRIRSQGGAGAAGIGSGYVGAGMGVIINAGLVVGTGSTDAAGIGGGSGSGGQVTINGGTVVGYGRGGLWR